MSVDTYFCFCCLSTDDLCTLFDKNSENNFANLLKELFAISPHIQEEAEDDYICKDCTVKLRDAHTFKTQVFDSINTLQTIGLINLRKVDGNLFIEKVPHICSDEEQDILRKLEKDVVSQSNETDSKSEPQPLTTEKIKGNKLENVQITGQGDIIRRFLANDPIKALERDKHIPPSTKESYEVPEDLKCKICMEVMPNVYTFHMHTNKHFPNHICELCGKGYATEKRLKRHKYCHNEGPFICEDCGAQFTNYSNYCAHRKHKHTGGPTYACALCGAHFRTLSLRARHAVSAHNEDAAYGCRQCSAKFRTSGLLNSHMKFKHLKLKRHFCKLCDAGYFHKEELLGHMATHSGQNPFKCTFCNKSYPRKKALIVHIKTHLGDKRFCCDVCGKRFVQKCTLTTHMNTHNRDKKKSKPKESKVENIPLKAEIIQAKVENIQAKVENIQAKVENIQAQVNNTQAKVNIQAKVDEIQPGSSKLDIGEAKVNDESELERDKLTKLDESGKPLLYNCYKIFY